MKQINQILNDLRDYLKRKDDELISADQPVSSYLYSLVDNRRKEIDSLELRFKSITIHPLLEAETIQNFAKEADSIKAEIDNIKL